MSTEQFLSRTAFDNIIASLEALLLEVQNLVASVDPLNDPQVIADIQSVADQLAEILTVAGISGDITTVAGESANISTVADNITQIQSIVDELQDILAVAAELPAIQTVAGDTAAVNAVAGSILAVQEVAANIQAVIDAVQAAEDAEQARDDAQTWAEGTDEAVDLLGGEKSSKGWAEESGRFAGVSLQGVKFKDKLNNTSELPSDPEPGDSYAIEENNVVLIYVWSGDGQQWESFSLGAGTSWGQITGIIENQTDLENWMAEKADWTGVYTKTETDDLLDDKFDKSGGTIDGVTTIETDSQYALEIVRTGTNAGRTRLRMSVTGFSGLAPEFIITGDTTSDTPGLPLYVPGRISTRDGFYIGSTRKDLEWDAKVDNNDSRLTNSREWNASTVSQSEAQAGSATTRRAWTAQRVRQAVAAYTSAFNPSGNYANLKARGTTPGEIGAEPAFTKNSGFNRNFGTGANTVTQGNDSRLSNSREWTASTVTAAQAQAGTSTTRLAWTPQRVRQAIERLASVKGGSSDTGVITTSGNRAVIASVNSRANANRSAVIASHGSQATGLSTFIASSDEDNTASGTRSTIIGSVGCHNSQSTTMILASHGVTNGGDDWNTLILGYSSNWQNSSSANRTHRFNTIAGTIQASGSIDAGEDFGDYAEFFKNGTGQEIEPGILVALDGDQVIPAQNGDDVIGVVSATAVITLGASSFCWHGRYLKDEWGRSIMEDIPDPAWKPDEEKEETEADRPIITVRKENPEWDPEQEQIPREDRPDEWTVVGLLGQVLVRVAENVQIGDYVKPGTNNVATTSTEKTNLRVMRETQEFDSGKGYKIVLCLLK